MNDFQSALFDILFANTSTEELTVERAAELAIDIAPDVLKAACKQGEQKYAELFDIPENSIGNDLSVMSRMEHISEELKPIANFILEYSHWNLHKDEWNHPVPEVPLFRVLDALVQKGKPYQGACCYVEQKPAEWKPSFAQLDALTYAISDLNMDVKVYKEKKDTEMLKILTSLKEDLESLLTKED